MQIDQKAAESASWLTQGADFYTTMHIILALMCFHKSECKLSRTGLNTHAEVANSAAQIISLCTFVEKGNKKHLIYHHHMWSTVQQRHHCWTACHKCRVVSPPQTNQTKIYITSSSLGD